MESFSKAIIWATIKNFTIVMENLFGYFTSTLSPTYLQTFRALLRNEEEIGELLMVIILNCQHLFDCNAEKINMILGSKFK